MTSKTDESNWSMWKTFLSIITQIINIKFLKWNFFGLRPSALNIVLSVWWALKFNMVEGVDISYMIILGLIVTNHLCWQGLMQTPDNIMVSVSIGLEYNLDIFFFFDILDHFSNPPKLCFYKLVYFAHLCLLYGAKYFGFPTHLLFPL